MREITIKYGIPSWLVRMVKTTLEKTNNKVKIHGKMSPSFKTVVDSGKETCYPCYYLICMEKVISNVTTNPGGTIFNRTRQCLLCADNVAVLECATCF